MTANATSFAKGNKAALKHGAYSASAQLEHQNRVLAEAAHRLQAKKLTPLQLTAYRLLQANLKRHRQVKRYLDKVGPLTPVGAVRSAAQYEATLSKNAYLQTVTLWKMFSSEPISLQAEDQTPDFSAYVISKDA